MSPAGPRPAGGLAAANPQPVGIGTQLSANGWSYTFPRFSTYAAVLGPQIGDATAQGTYMVVLVSVANNTGSDQPLPPDFFVLKDAQGPVYDQLTQLSDAYVIRGVNADIGQGIRAGRRVADQHPAFLRSSMARRTCCCSPAAKPTRAGR